MIAPVFFNVYHYILNHCSQPHDLIILDFVKVYSIQVYLSFINTVVKKMLYILFARP